MKWTPSQALVWLWLWVAGAGVGVASGYHILGVFVNVHRSQLLVDLAVARVLLERGHRLTLVTTLPLESDWLILPNIHHILIPIIPAEEEKHEQPKGKSRHDNFVTQLHGTLSRLERTAEFMHQATWQEFMHTVPRPRYDLMLLGYHFNEYLLGVAAHFECPVVIIHTQQPISFVHSLMGNPEERSYVPQPYDSRQRTGLAGLLFGLWEKSCDLLARRVMQRVYSQHFPTQRYPSYEEMRRRVVLALCNHHMLSEGPIGPVLPTMLDIGGIVQEQSSSSGKAWNLATTIRRPFIIFSLGTRFTWRTASSHLEQLFVSSFAQLPEYDIYWTYDGTNGMGINMTHGHIKLSKWWPQPQLLALPGAQLFITHGGKGSLSEALYHGVPMLGLPLAGDQRANLHKMQTKGWGLRLSLENLQQEQLLNATRRLLNEQEFKQRILRDSKLYKDRSMNASFTTSYWLEYVIRHKGAKHLYNPGRELNFWQYYLLDVRLVIYGVLGLLTWLVLWLNRKLNRGEMETSAIAD